ncbi:aminotransferase-like domain-containing protein [Propionispora hippei]|uniref:2-aminoadipate transaminase n=1 Tax=Propionispora hippei DSM 15287 TaxID=1123003 RepID=A0A1M6BZ70_9FIRM|nr:PLP-dependent aminotransferase family protein [Propionispora hippei]SHI53891.1 2-aminoadipate transaminase [Propionispora hippei DSM 15287]
MHNILARRASLVKASEIREILKVTENSDIISFAGGLPAPELFPVEEMKTVCQAILAEDGMKALQYSTTEGYKPLREMIAGRMRALSIAAQSEDILITTGSQQGLDLSGKVLLDEGDGVICESPTYLAAINAFKVYSPNFIEIAMDEQGMRMDELETALEHNHRIKCIYTIPDFQNPTGRTMSLERRKKLIELANRFAVMVIEDNPYGELRFSGDRLPPVKSFDTEGRVIYQSTFSKVLTPGIRVGWICAAPEIMQKYVVFKQGTDLHTSTFSQMQVNKFVELFDIEEHVSKIRQVYRRRRDCMLEAIRREFPDYVTYTEPEGGLFLWITLPAVINARDVLLSCLQQKVAFVPGGAFFPNGGHENTLRLNFSNMTEARIVEGIGRMAGILKECKNTAAES